MPIGSYAFTRQADGPGNIIYAARVNELQESIEGVGIRLGSAFVAGKRYSPVSTFSGAFTSATAVVANRLYAVPFFTGPAGITMTSLNLEVTTLSAGNARMGIYAADVNPPYYPAGLLLDAGEVATGTTGVKTIDITDALYIGTAPSQLLWLASVFAVTPSIRYVSQIGIIEIDATGAAQAGVSMTHTYAALPSAFTTEGTVGTAPNLWTVAG